MRFVLLASALFALNAAGSCFPVTGDRIWGRDLALADATFAGLPPNLQLGYAPVPGVRRVFPVAELQRLARTNGLDLKIGSELCFEVPVHALSDAELMENMRRSLPPAASLQIVDRANADVPAGRIEFPLSGLEPPALGNHGIQLWRGLIQYTDTRRIAIWARVIVVTTYATVIARHDLAANTRIDATGLRVEIRTGALAHTSMAARVEDVVGRVLQRPLRAGAEIPLSLLEEAPSVRRGDSVRVEVQSGMAVLRFDAIAESTARAGEVAELRNPVSGKLFRARISAGSSAGGSMAFIVVGKGNSL